MEEDKNVRKKKQKKLTKHTQVIYLYALCELVIFKGLTF